jgi:hypothetical protein
VAGYDESKSFAVESTSLWGESKNFALQSRNFRGLSTSLHLPTKTDTPPRYKTNKKGARQLPPHSFHSSIFRALQNPQIGICLTCGVILYIEKGLHRLNTHSF